MPLALIAAAALAYSNTFTAPFIFDDQSAVLENPNILHVWPLTKSMWAPPDNPNTGRPMVSLSLALNHAISGFNTWSYHVFNLLVHALMGLAVLGIVRRTLRLPRFAYRCEESAEMLALTIAMIWIVHPLCTESVTYISTRTESMMGMFYAWSMYASIRVMTTEHPSARCAWGFTAFIMCCCSAASKEVAATAPVVILLFDRVFVSNSWRETFTRRWGLHLALMATWIESYLLVVTTARAESVGFHFDDLPWWVYLFTQSRVILHYLSEVFWPHPIVADYHGWPVFWRLSEALPYALPVTAMLITAIVLLFTRRFKPVGYLGLSFFLILAPSSSVIPLSTEIAADRRMYVPLIAVVSLIVLAGHCTTSRIADVRTRSTVNAIAAGMLIIALALLTFNRNRDYRDPLRFWTHEVTHRPGNARARINLALNYSQAGRDGEAEIEYRKAIALERDNYLAHTNYAALLLNQRRVPEALEHAQQAARLAPTKWITRVNYGVTLAAAHDLEQAVVEIKAGIDLYPEGAWAWTMLANAYAEMGRQTESNDAFNRARAISQSRQ